MFDWSSYEWATIVLLAWIGWKTSNVTRRLEGYMFRLVKLFEDNVGKCDVVDSDNSLISNAQETSAILDSIERLMLALLERLDR